LHKTFLPDPASLFCPLFSERHELFMPAQVIIVLFKRGRVLSPRLAVVRVADHAPFPGQRSDDFASHLILERPGIGSRLVEALGPRVLAAPGIDELSNDAGLVPFLAYAAFEYVPDTELLADLSHVDRLSFISEGGCSCDHR
jgi:hypothetical protein